MKAFTENIDACRCEWEGGHLESALLFARQAAAAHPKSVQAAQLVARVSRQMEYVEQLRSEMVSAAAAGNFEQALQLAGQLDDMGVPPQPQLLRKGATA